MISPYTLVVMTTGMSLGRWKSCGLLSRELGYYEALSQQTGPVRLLSYGSPADESTLLHTLSSSVEVLCAPRVLGSLRHTELLSSLFAPISNDGFRGCRIVRSNQFNGSWTGLMIARRLGVPFILRCGYLYSKHYSLSSPQSKLRNRAVSAIEKYVAHAADAIIVTYKAAKVFFHEQHGIPLHKIHVLGNPIDTDVFKPEPDAAFMGQVVTVGRHKEQKNLESLIRACADLGVSLTLIGSGPLTEDLRKLSNDLGADVRFLGNVPNETIPKILAGHKVFALPSFYEGNPKALLEAMAVGMPIVASDVEEHHGIIEDGREGLLCGTGVSDIRTVLQKLLDDSALRHNLGINARQRILREYSKDGIASREHVIHEQLLASFDHN